MLFLVDAKGDGDFNKSYIKSHDIHILDFIVSFSLILGSYFGKDINIGKYLPSSGYSKITSDYSLKVDENIPQQVPVFNKDGSLGLIPESELDEFKAAKL